MPAKLVAMLKTHAVQEKKGGVPKLVVVLGGAHDNQQKNNAAQKINRCFGL